MELTFSNEKKNLLLESSRRFPSGIIWYLWGNMQQTQLLSFAETTLSIHTEIQRQGYGFCGLMITQRTLKKWTLLTADFPSNQWVCSAELVSEYGLRTSFDNFTIIRLPQSTTPCPAGNSLPKLLNSHRNHAWTSGQNLRSKNKSNSYHFFSFLTLCYMKCCHCFTHFRVFLLQ